MMKLHSHVRVFCDKNLSPKTDLNNYYSYDKDLVVDTLYLSLSENASTPYFAIVYGRDPKAYLPITLDILIICPRVLLTSGRNAFVTLIIPHKLTSIHRCTCSIANISTGARPTAIPALLTAAHKPRSKQEKRCHIVSYQ